MSQKLSNLPIGAKVKFGRYQVASETPQRIEWIVVAKNHDGYPSNSVTLHTAKIIDFLCYDALEPNNSDEWCVLRGNSDYELSNIDQWLNKSNSDGSWYAPSHEFDSPPDYANRSGFLSNFSNYERRVILPTSILARKPLSDIYQSINRKVFLLSLAEVGEEDPSDHDACDGAKLEYYTDAGSRTCTVSQQCVENTTLSEITPKWWVRGNCPINTHVTSTIGSDGSGERTAYFSKTLGVRPALNLSAETLVSDSTDEDGCYTIVWDQSTSADAVDFDDENTVIRTADGTFSYWWYLKYYNGKVSIVMGDKVDGT